MLDNKSFNRSGGWAQNLKPMSLAAARLAQAFCRKMKIPKFTDPAAVNRNLHQVALYLIAWETLRSGVIERVKGFFTDNWTIDDKGKLRGTPTDEYKKRVIALNPKDELHACTLWLQELGAFDAADIEQISVARRHRNSVGHEIVDYITRDDIEVDRDTIAAIYHIVKKLDTWWFTEVQLAIEPDVSDEMFEAARRGEAIGGYSMLLELILPVFDGNFDTLLDLHSSLKTMAEQDGAGQPATRSESK